MNNQNFYRAFEDKFRGSRENIKSRLEVYLPFVLPLKEIYEEFDVLDIGCGRGEWLELMSENGFNATGVDIDDGMLAACKDLGLNAMNKDALFALKELPDESQVVISGFHIAEHLPFDTLLEIVKESKRVLKPAGMLILETPNPANIYVGTNSFYFDPTHTSPIPSELLSFLPEFFGYKRIKVLGLQEGQKENGTATTSIFDVYFNSSPDYAVVAQKEADQNILSLFDNEFAKNYGLSINTLCNRFEESIKIRFDKIAFAARDAKEKAQSAEAKAQSAEAKAQSAEAKAQSAEAKAQSAEAKAQSAEDALNAIYTSRSWKITAPYRILGDFTKNSKQRTVNVLKSVAAKCVKKIENYPRLKGLTSKLISHFPKIKSRFNRFYEIYYVPKYYNDAQFTQTCNLKFFPLTSHGKQIYEEIKKEIAQRNEAV